MRTVTYSKKAFYFATTSFITVCLSLTAITANAQLPDTKNTVVYSVAGSTIYNYDPSMPVETGINPKANKIALPKGAKSCVAVSKNLQGSEPMLTFYTMVEGSYFYFDGAKWINTNHTCGDLSINNIISGGNYLYNYT